MWGVFHQNGLWSEWFVTFDTSFGNYETTNLWQSSTLQFCSRLVSIHHLQVQDTIDADCHLESTRPLYVSTAFGKIHGISGGRFCTSPSVILRVSSDRKFPNPTFIKTFPFSPNKDLLMSWKSATAPRHVIFGDGLLVGNGNSFLLQWVCIGHPVHLSTPKQNNTGVRGTSLSLSLQKSIYVYIYIYRYKTYIFSSLWINSCTLWCF